VVLSMYEGGDASMVDDGEVDEEHVKAAGPTVCLLGSTFDVCGWGGLSEEWGCDI
jgi:hypothetical protein